MDTINERSELRRKLSEVINRGRHRPTVNDLLNEACVEKIPEPKTCDTHKHTVCHEVAWERVTLNLHDKRDPSQTRLKLLLVKRKNIPDDARLPVVCILHATAKSCETEEMLLIKVRFARNGFLAVGLNSRYHGCRRGKGYEGKGEYLKSLVEAWQRNGTEEHETNLYPFIYDTAADLVSVADYLYTRKDVRKDHLGITGISLGGMHAWFAAAADVRWTAVVPLIGVQSFAYAVERGCFQARVASIQDVFDAAAGDMGCENVTAEVVRAVWQRICPGLLDKFDAPRSLALLSPRPVFVANGEDDPRCPIAGVIDAVLVARKAFEEDCGDGGRLELRVYEDVGHKVTTDMWEDCLRFFLRVLQSSAPQVVMTDLQR